MWFEVYEGMRVMRAMSVFESVRVLQVFEGFEGKYSNSECFFY